MSMTTGEVIAVNEWGFKLKGHESYLNYSKEEYRDTPFDIPEKGDWVSCEIVSGKYIKTCKIQRQDQDVPFDDSSGPSPENKPPRPDRDTLIGRQVALKCATDLVAFIDLEDKHPASVAATVADMARVLAEALE